MFLGQPAPLVTNGEASQWEERGTLLLYNRLAASPAETLHVAAFDLDGTIITTASKRRHAKDENDWVFLYPEVTRRLSELAAKGYFIVIATNQLGVGMDTTGKLKAQFKTKVERIFEKIRVPVVLLAALGRDEFRKPCSGMWDYLLREVLVQKTVDTQKSFFVGDAAGRPDGWKAGRRADHASVDRKFAINVDLCFLTPEEFFLNEPKVSCDWEDFNPKTLLLAPQNAGPFQWQPRDDPEILIFVGSPASGKTTFFRRFLVQHNYTLVNQDTLKTKARCMAVFRQAAEAGHKVAVDNTNPSAEARRPFIDYAKSKNIPVRCLLFPPHPHLTRHLNVHRAITKKQERLPEVAFAWFESRFQRPSLDEGFEEIVELPFTPLFDSEYEKSVFSKYLI